MSVSVCLSVCVCVFVCPRLYLQNYTSDLHQIFVRVAYGHGSVLIWRRNDMLRISGFVDDVICEHKLRLRRRRKAEAVSSHSQAALGLARRNTRCRQRTLGTTSCSRGLLGRSGHLEY